VQQVGITIVAHPAGQAVCDAALSCSLNELHTHTHTPHAHMYKQALVNLLSLDVNANIAKVAIDGLQVRSKVVCAWVCLRASLSALHAHQLCVACNA